MEFDPLTALEKWAEEGMALDTLLATHKDKKGKTLWTRSLCTYHKVTKYRGAGDANDGANFTCDEL